MNKLPVLLLPGTLCTAAVFNHQIDELARLAPGVDVVQFTLEDSISKMADKAIRCIPRQGSAAIIGFSMGGMVAMEIARKAPELIGKLALLNTSFHADLPERGLARIQHLKEAKSSSMGSVIRQYYLDRYLYEPEPDASQLIVEMANELGTPCFAVQINAHTTRVDSSDVLAGIECPPLVLGSSHDQLCPRDEQNQMHQLIKGSKLKILDRCGHFSMLEKPVEVNRALRDWYLQD